MNPENKNRIKIVLPQYNRTLLLRKSENLMELFQREGFFVASDCAGAGTCGKCQVKISAAEMPVSESDRNFLTLDQINDGIRLACRFVPESDCQVEFLTSEEPDSDVILTEGHRQKIDIQPRIKREKLTVAKPELGQDQFDFESILQALHNGAGQPRVSLSFLEKLSVKLRDNDYQISLIYNDRHYIEVEPISAPDAAYGLAIDLGTTTLVVKLIDLNSGSVKAVASGVNPQRQVGADVISRIGYSQRKTNAFKRLQKMVVDQLNKMIGTVSISAGISAKQIYDVVIVGNTVMGHLLLGLDATHLALSPYTPVVQFYPPFQAAEIKLSVHPRADVYLMPNIGRFVGSDTTGVILATGLDQRDELTLMIDIGTNGEIVLGNRNRILATSTAAGPAFEGAKIRFGMRASQGAIDRVSMQDGELQFHTVENDPTKGLCGSGIISLIGELIHAGVLSWSGQILSRDELKNGSASLKKRIIEEDGQRVFLLDESVNGRIFLTQRDVREIQLAKSAIRTGINLLLAEFGVEINQVDRILLAGAFGNFLDREQAIRIGLLPDVATEKIRFVGNAACAGAELALISRKMRRQAEEIARKTEYFEIATHPQFQDEYAENMLFPVNRQ